MTTVEKIHNEIDTAADRLLAEANAIISKGMNLSSKAERLKKVGFLGARIVKKYAPIVKTKELADIIEYHKQVYPFYKFITESELDRLCKKYNLIYAPIASYIAEVPEKNLIEIERMTPLCREDMVPDKLMCKRRRENGPGMPFLNRTKKLYYTLPVIVEGHFSNQYSMDRYLRENYNTEGYEYLTSSIQNVTLNRSGLFIAAPKSKFDLTGLKVSGSGFFNFTIIEPKDPIVFRYVRGGIQVITKWGEEASDPALLNETDN